ncbi:MAG: glycosyltransferase family 2 protein, partial [Patescibacteria group bacterium]|nr:glycosyltransferase family 2 protein [Patescibacteria group bacterium]
MAKISVVINTLNEEKNLPKVFKSIRNLADEVVVVDMDSEDKTCEIAKKFGAKVYRHPRTNYVEPARNFAISKVTHDWVLVLDADEEIGPELSDLLRKFSNQKEIDYYRLPRKNIIFGKWIKNSMWWPDYNIRFFKKGCVVWKNEIHSVPDASGKGKDIEENEKYAIIHHNYQTIDQYLQKMLRYTSAQANDLIKKNYNFSWKDLINKPSIEFIRRFYQSSGYKDGLHGLALSLLQAFSEFIVYLKVWQNQKFKQEQLSLQELEQVFREVKSEKNYWHADACLREGKGFV